MSQLDFPFLDVVAQARKHALDGHMVHQKFTCGRCGSRQTMEKPNTFFTTGRCEECRFVTDIEARGCNFVLVTHTSASTPCE